MNDKKLKSLIFDTIKSYSKKRFSRRELFKRIGVKGLDYASFKRILTDLEKEGSIVRLKGRKFALPEESGLFTGVFTAARNGGGFVSYENGASLFVNSVNTGGALSGDRVQVKILKRGRGGLLRTAKIVKIIERTTHTVIGLFKISGTTSWVIPEEKGFPVMMLVKKGGECNAENGDLVVVRIENPIRGFSQPVCVVTEVLGSPDAPGMDVLIIVKRHQLPMQFPDAALEEARQFKEELTPDILEKRRDIRSMVTFTIDPEDAKDFDDSISISRDGDSGFEIGVHIADVSHYVKDKSAVDNEAKGRGMSCYLVDRVIPMLPERLSNDLCSLKSGVDRLTKSVFVSIDKNGEIISSEISNTVINSDIRLTYQQVQFFLDGRKRDSALGITLEVGSALKILSDLTDILVARRRERGALDFEIPEARVILDDVGTPVNIVVRERLKAHRMVEEAMLLANTVVATALGNTKIPFLYRIHEQPDVTKLEMFRDVALALGYEFNLSKAHNQKYIQKFLESRKGKKHELLLNMLLLRSMKKASYSPHNRGHYGLALPVYAHFTSPIRRYPDLIVHRQIDTAILRNDIVSRSQNLSYYEILGNEITEREIITDTAERDSIKMKTADFMNRHLGEEFEGTISGVIPIGFFVKLKTYFVDGLVHVSTLDNDYYEIDRTGIALIGRNRGQRFMVGDRVRVAVVSADKKRGEVDFILVQKLK